MSASPIKPLVGVSASLLAVSDARYIAHAAGETNIDSLSQYSQCLPMILPAMGERLDIESLLPQLDGLLLTGGRANIEPHHFGGVAFPQDEPIDPQRDATVLPLIRAAVRANVPIFGICRGIQELNVALGGSLHYRIHLLPGKCDHRMPRHEDVTMQEIFELRHSIKLTRNGYLAGLFDTDEFEVNSLHGQGLDRLGDGLIVEALSPDGVVEAVSLRDSETFTVGVQWHAEWEPHTHALSKKLFEAFGDAARLRAQTKAGG
jgi:putative glutamine amidotransferase